MKRQTWSGRVVSKYALLQLPGLALLVIVLVLAMRWFDLPACYAWGILLLWVVKDTALFPFVWRAYDKAEPDGVGTMIGRRGTAKDRLSPSGYILVGGELWQAEVIEGNAPVERGAPVRVHGISGLTLLVTSDLPEDESKAEKTQ